MKVFDYDKLGIDGVISRVQNDTEQVEAVVKSIVADVRRRGDAALREYCQKFDKVSLDKLEVTEQEIKEAVNAIDEDFRTTLIKAKERIYAFHSLQKREGFETKGEDGEVLGQKVLPIEKVGIYVPGGTASYPSTVLMNAVPAAVAGVKEIIMVTPCSSEGKVPSSILAAAYYAGVNRVFKIGGAQAIAALAYGTESVPKVDKIVGPGNIFVATAKKLVFGAVNIDMIAGPSEILIIADETANPVFVAADLLSQAEHDKLATAILVTTSPRIAESVDKETERQLAVLPRENIARASIDNNGKIILCKTLDEAVLISNAIAPEHLELCIREPLLSLDKITNAGSVFLGNYTPEALGDYMAGPNHTLPTGGTARFSSPLSVDDFIKKTQYIAFNKKALDKLGKQIIGFAEKEGLSGHGRAVAERIK